MALSSLGVMDSPRGEGSFRKWGWAYFRTLGMIRASLAEWRHGLVTCPGCGLPVDEHRDEVKDLYVVTSAEPYAAIVTHRRCGAHFQIEFGSGPRS